MPSTHLPHRGGAAAAEPMADTLAVASSKPARGGEACLVQIYPPGPAMGVRHPLAGGVAVVGRGPECDIRADDPTVSRQHARVEWHDGGHSAVDLGSTNGTRVNGVRTTASRLRDGDYLRVGDVVFRYLAGGNVEADYHEELYRLTILDPLTGAHNKRYLLEFLERELARSARHARPLALVLFDLDRFKAVNDALGHLGGDFTLQETVACARGCLRKGDLLARYGGEEFAVVLPEEGLAGAAAFAERLRAAVEHHPFRYGGMGYSVTLSAGVAAAGGGEPLGAEDVIRVADEKLYDAKRQGRNRVAA